MPNLRVEARSFAAGDEALFLEGAQAARRAAGAGSVPSLEELRWRYGSAPHGACVAFALDGSRAVAGLCATRQRMRFQDSEVHWLEVGDLFNDFSHGEGLARARGLLEAGKAFAETFGGFAPEKHPVVYGRPSRRAHRIGLRHLQWEVLRSENELVLELEEVDEGPASDLAVQELQRFPDDVQAAFEGWAAGRVAVLVRDAAYLNWRYVEQPGLGFELAMVRRGAHPLGWAVLRDGFLYEWGAPPEDPQAVGALLSWARARTRASRHASLRVTVPETTPEWLLFQRLGFRVQGTRDYLCFRSFQRPAIMSWLFKNWSYTRSDFCGPRD